MPIKIIVAPTICSAEVLIRAMNAEFRENTSPDNTNKVKLCPKAHRRASLKEFFREFLFNTKLDTVTI
jgi:hypothetical protein